MMQMAFAEIIGQPVCGYRERVRFFFHQFYSCAAAQGVNLLFQSPDAGFHGIFGDDFFKRLFGYG